MIYELQFKTVKYFLTFYNQFDYIRIIFYIFCKIRLVHVREFFFMSLDFILSLYIALYFTPILIEQK